MCVRLLWCPRCVSVGRDAGALGGCGRLCQPQWVCPLCPVSPFCKRGPLGVSVRRWGDSPFVCGFPSRSHILVLWVTPLLGEGSPGPSARARARVSSPGPFVSVRVLPGDSMGVPGPRGWPPRLVTTPLRGVRVPSARGRASCSRDLRLERRPPGWAFSGVSARARPVWVLSRTQSAVCGFSFANVVSCFVSYVCATCFRGDGSRVQRRRLGSLRRKTGGEIPPALAPPPRLFGASSLS